VRYLCVLALLIGIYAYAVEPRMIRLEKVAIPIDSLPENLEGFTIGVLADLHLDTIRPEVVRHAVDMLNAENPDLVLVAGDFASDASMFDRINEAVGALDNPYGVPGNWDRWCEDPSYKNYVRIDMLVNRGIEAAPHLWLCGIDDAMLGNPSIDSAVAGAPEGAIKILLAHEPDVADWVEPHHGISLQISGHSHGGQVRLPFIGPLLLPPLGKKYPAGLAHAPTHWVYTNRGLGMSHIQVRFMCPPEVTLITLTRK